MVRRIHLRGNVLDTTYGMYYNEAKADMLFGECYAKIQEYATQS